MEATLRRPRGAPSDVRLRRYRLRASAEDVGRKAGFSVWKVFRIERDPGAARVDDILALNEALGQLELETAAKRVQP
jgi:hypothetical protein